MLYAIKHIKERIVAKKQGMLLLREVGALALLTALHCPHLIHYYSSWIEDQKIYIQLEWCNLGSLEDMIAPNPSRFSIFATRSQQLRSRTTSINAVRNRSDSYQAMESTMEAFTPVGLPDTATSIFTFPGAANNNNNNAASTTPTNIPVGASERLSWYMLQVISECLAFMHAHSLVHLDIRPANIFLQHNSTANGSVGTDVATSPRTQSLFSTVMQSLSQTSLSSNGSAGSGRGLPRQFSTDQPSSTNVREELEERILQQVYLLKVGDLGHVRGTYETGYVNEGETRYCPRELINADPRTLDLTKADVFSLGATIYELCLGRYLGSNGEEEMVEWHSIR